MSAAHEVGELALDLGARGAVVVLPAGSRWRAGAGERFFVGTDADGAPAGRRGALGSQGAGGTGVFEVGHAAAVAVTADRHGDTGGAGDGAGADVDVEAVLGEEAAGGHRVLGLAPRLDALVFETLWKGPVP